MNNLLSYCGLVDAGISPSEKIYLYYKKKLPLQDRDLPYSWHIGEQNVQRIKWQHFFSQPVQKFLILFEYFQQMFWLKVDELTIDLMWQLCAEMMSWVGRWVELVVYVLKDSECFILFAENSQIFLKISVIPILLTFMYRISSYSFRGNYSFLTFALCTVTFDHST